MKARITLIMLALSCIMAIPCSATEAPPKADTVYIIPIKGVIERALLYVVRRGLIEAKEKGAAAIIFHMDTPGGLVGVTEEIVRMLIDLPEDIKTYTFVDKDALSAGSFIAMATDEIYMTPGSRLGASAIITAFGDLPEGDTREKTFSALTSLVMSAAELHGHDPKLAEAMIRKEKEYKIGKEVICPADELLTLSETDASRIVKRDGKKAPLLSAGTVKSLDELKEKLGILEENIIELNITTEEKVARYIELFAVLFLIGGILGIYIEVKTPGFGVPGILGTLLLGIFFWGHNVAGLSGLGEVILFVTGLTLIAFEIFVIPGFGAAGIAGICCVVASLLMAMIPHLPGTSWAPSMPHFETAAFNLSLSILITFVAAILLAKVLPKTSFYSKLVMPATVDGHVTLTSVNPSEVQEGLKGLAVTDLRPAGTADFNNKRIDVVTEGTFIKKDAHLIITEVHGNRVIVEEKE